MKKRINIVFCLVNSIIIIITLTISIYVLYSILKQQIINDLRIEEARIESSGQLEDLSKLKEEINFANIRVTLIDTDGNVLYESNADYAHMENHKDRPEFIDAMKKGEGISLRNSETIGKTTYYFAVQLDNGNILRVSREASTVLPLFVHALYIFIIVIILLVILCLFTSSLLTKWILKPIKQIAENIEEINEEHLYDELIPFAKKIKEQHDNIRNNLEELERESHKIQMMTNSMSEGIIFLDQERHIVSLNYSASLLLSLKEKNYQGQSVLAAVRNSELIDSIELAYQGESNFIELTIEGRHLQVFANPILDGEQVLGIMCFILDITEKYNRDKMRREFTANVSHELKTPLTAISGYSELIKLNIAKKEDIESFATKIYQESMRLLALINDIIKLSEIDEGIIIENFEELDLLQLVNECVKMLEDSAKHHEVSLRVMGESMIIRGNRSMLSQLIYNLIENAIRYNKQNGIVEVKVEEKQNKAILSVIDTGIGIPQKYQERVFERFFRVDKSRSKSTGGTGLGLSIVKHIANAHQAAIECKSEENKGTRISIYFIK